MSAKISSSANAYKPRSRRRRPGRHRKCTPRAQRRQALYTGGPCR